MFYYSPKRIPTKECLHIYYCLYIRATAVTATLLTERYLMRKLRESNPRYEKRMLVFKTSAIDHSAKLPMGTKISTQYVVYHFPLGQT